MLYQFETGRIDYYDGLNLTLIQLDTSVLRFEHIKHLAINKNGISFHGKYVPSPSKIVGLKYKNKNNDDCEINVIYLREDHNGICVYHDPNIPNFDNLDISKEYYHLDNYEFLPLSEAYYQIIMTELKEKGYVYNRNDIKIYKDIWKPENGGIYWYITSFGSVTQTIYTEDYIQDKLRMSIENCFQTKKQADEAKEAFVKWFKTYRQQD